MLGRVQPHLFPAIFGPHENEPLDLAGAQRAFAQVREACWSPAALSQLRCEFTDLRTTGHVVQERYHRSHLQEFALDPLTHQFNRATQSIGGIPQWIEDRLSGSHSCRATGPTTQVCRVPVTVESEYELFVELLRNRLASLTARAPASARDCFAACFVKCATAQLLNYNERENQSFSQFVNTRYFSTPAAIWSRGEGECSEIATIASDIGRRLGAAISNIATSEHEFNAVRINGQSYSMDAASPSCLFMQDF
jgi:hypothetical protein